MQPAKVGSIPVYCGLHRQLNQNIQIQDGLDAPTLSATALQEGGERRRGEGDEKEDICIQG